MSTTYVPGAQRGWVLPGTGVRDGCEPPVGIVSQTQVFCKSTECSQLLSNLPSTYIKT